MIACGADGADVIWSGLVWSGQVRSSLVWSWLGWVDLRWFSRSFCRGVIVCGVDGAAVIDDVCMAVLASTNR